MSPGMVIVGGGNAGGRAAVALRERGWKGSINLIGDEPHLPYERPPLSKEMLTSQECAGPKFIHAQSVLEQHRVAHTANCRVVAIDRPRRTIRLNDGREMRYERLLLATGSKPRVLSSIEVDAQSVMSLRTFSDALYLRSALTPGSRIIIIGGGCIGLELSSSAVKRGVTVTIVEAGSRVLMRGVPAKLAKLIESAHRQAGVDILLSAEVESVRNSACGKIVALRDGNILRADTVVAGVGAVPETSIAENAGLATENGISADAFLATSDPHIFAAGDCCSFPHDLYGGKRIRLETWKNSQQQGSLAAANMLGEMSRYRAVPWFWSNQHEQVLQVAGLPDEGVSHLERTLPDGGAMLYHTSSDGRLVAASAFGRLKHIAREMRAAEALIERRGILDLQQFARPVAPLPSLLPSAS